MADLIQSCLFAMCFSLLSTANELVEYNETLAFLHLQYSRVAFCDDDAIKDWSCGDMCDNTAVNKDRVVLIGPGRHAGVLAYLAETPGNSRCIVSFRGSVNPSNWQTDAKLWFKDWPPLRRADGSGNVSWCPDCRVHHGFAQAYEELRTDMLNALENNLTCRDIIIVGHSLGAAVATLAALDLRGSGTHVSELWTFGSPRVGNPEFVEAFVNVSRDMNGEAVPPSWRVVHYHDPVPQGGPSSDWMHLPQEVYYKDRQSSKHVTCGWNYSAFENLTCGLRTLEYGDMMDGVVAMDHIKYMNKTFALKEMNAQCRKENVCAERGYFSTFTVVQIACCVGILCCILGSVTEKMLWRYRWSYYKASAVPGAAAAPYVELSEGTA